MKVLIGVPALDLCATDFTMSLASLCAHHAYDRRLRREVPIALACSKGSIIPHARNVLIQQALDNAATHLLFLDSDMTFPPNALDRLIAHSKDAVGADYVNRIPPHTLNGLPDHNHPHTPGIPLRRMLTMPFGVMLLRMSAVAKLPQPWFRYIEGGDETKTMSEDSYFCHALRLKGIPLWCDMKLTAEVGHVGSQVFRPGASQLA